MPQSVPSDRLELRLHSPARNVEPVVYSWPLQVNRTVNEATEIIDTIKWVCRDFPELWPAMQNNVVHEIESSSFEKMKALCDKYNRSIDHVKRLWSGQMPPKCLGMRAQPELVRHIFQQVYNHSVVDPEKLNLYEPFSPEVYGETSFELVNKIIERVGIKSTDSFIDLGSGVGNVVLHVAAMVDCKRIMGIEKAERPAAYAKEMEKQFRKWMAWYGKKFTPFTLTQGDFLIDEFQETISTSSFIFANNFAFGPHVNHQLKERFAHLEEGTRLVSSREFCPINFRITARNLSDIGTILSVIELESIQGAVSWTDKPVSYYLHTVDRKRLEKYFHAKKYGIPEESDEESGAEIGRMSLAPSLVETLSKEANDNDLYTDGTSDTDALYDARGTCTRQQWRMQVDAVRESRRLARRPATLNGAGGEGLREVKKNGKKVRVIRLTASETSSSAASPRPEETAGDADPHTQPVAQWTATVAPDSAQQRRKREREQQKRRTNSLHRKVRQRIHVRRRSTGSARAPTSPMHHVLAAQNGDHPVAVNGVRQELTVSDSVVQALDEMLAETRRQYMRYMQYSHSDTDALVEAQALLQQHRDHQQRLVKRTALLEEQVSALKSEGYSLLQKRLDEMRLSSSSELVAHLEAAGTKHMQLKASLAALEIELAKSAEERAGTSEPTLPSSDSATDSKPVSIAAVNNAEGGRCATTQPVAIAVDAINAAANASAAASTPAVQAEKTSSADEASTPVAAVCTACTALTPTISGSPSSTTISLSSRAAELPSNNVPTVDRAKMPLKKRVVWPVDKCPATSPANTAVTTSPTQPTSSSVAVAGAGVGVSSPVASLVSSSGMPVVVPSTGGLASDPMLNSTDQPLWTPTSSGQVQAKLFAVAHGAPPAAAEQPLPLQKQLPPAVSEEDQRLEEISRQVCKLQKVSTLPPWAPFVQFYLPDGHKTLSRMNQEQVQSSFRSARRKHFELKTQLEDEERRRKLSWQGSGDADPHHPSAPAPALPSCLPKPSAAPKPPLPSPVPQHQTLPSSVPQHQPLPSSVPQHQPLPLPISVPQHQPLPLPSPSHKAMPPLPPLLPPDSDSFAVQAQHQASGLLHSQPAVSALTPTDASQLLASAVVGSLLVNAAAVTTTSSSLSIPDLLGVRNQLVTSLLSNVSANPGPLTATAPLWSPASSMLYQQGPGWPAPTAPALPVSSAASSAAAAAAATPSVPVDGAGGGSKTMVNSMLSGKVDIQSLSVDEDLLKSALQRVRSSCPSADSAATGQPRHFTSPPSASPSGELPAPWNACGSSGGNRKLSQEAVKELPSVIRRSQSVADYIATLPDATAVPEAASATSTWADASRSAFSAPIAEAPPPPPPGKPPRRHHRHSIAGGESQRRPGHSHHHHHDHRMRCSSSVAAAGGRASSGTALLVSMLVGPRTPPTVDDSADHRPSTPAESRSSNDDKGSATSPCAAEIRSSAPLCAPAVGDVPRILALSSPPEHPLNTYPLGGMCPDVDFSKIPELAASTSEEDQDGSSVDDGESSPELGEESFDSGIPCSEMAARSPPQSPSSLPVSQELSRLLPVPDNSTLAGGDSVSSSGVPAAKADNTAATLKCSAVASTTSSSLAPVLSKSSALCFKQMGGATLKEEGRLAESGSSKQASSVSPEWCRSNPDSPTSPAPVISPTKAACTPPSGSVSEDQKVHHRQSSLSLAGKGAECQDGRDAATAGTAPATTVSADTASAKVDSDGTAPAEVDSVDTASAEVDSDDSVAGTVVSPTAAAAAAPVGIRGSRGSSLSDTALVPYGLDEDESDDEASCSDSGAAPFTSPLMASTDENEDNIDNEEEDEEEEDDDEDEDDGGNDRGDRSMVDIAEPPAADDLNLSTGDDVAKNPLLDAGVDTVKEDTKRQDDDVGTAQEEEPARKESREVESDRTRSSDHRNADRDATGNLDATTSSSHRRQRSPPIMTPAMNKRRRWDNQEREPPRKKPTVVSGALVVCSVNGSRAVLANQGGDRSKATPPRERSMERHHRGPLARGTTSPKRTSPARTSHDESGDRVFTKSRRRVRASSPVGNGTAHGGGNTGVFSERRSSDRVSRSGRSYGSTRSRSGSPASRWSRSRSRSPLSSTLSVSQQRGATKKTLSCRRLSSPTSVRHAVKSPARRRSRRVESTSPPRRSLRHVSAAASPPPQKSSNQDYASPPRKSSRRADSPSPPLQEGGSRHADTAGSPPRSRRGSLSRPSVPPRRYSGGGREKPSPAGKVNGGQPSCSSSPLPLAAAESCKRPADDDAATTAAGKHKSKRRRTSLKTRTAVDDVDDVNTAPGGGSSRKPPSPVATSESRGHRRSSKWCERYADDPDESDAGQESSPVSSPLAVR